MTKSPLPADFNHWLAGFFFSSLTEIVLTVSIYRDFAPPCKTASVVKRIWGADQPLTAAPCFLLSPFQLFSPPARALAAEASNLERTLSGLVSQD